MSARSSPPSHLPLVAGLVVLVAMLLAGIASRYASPSPDGLERVADDRGLAQHAVDHPLADSPVADYSLRGVDDEGWATGAAGVLGVAGTLAVGSGVAAVLQRVRRPARDRTGSDGARPAAAASER